MMDAAGSFSYNNTAPQDLPSLDTPSPEPGQNQLGLSSPELDQFLEEDWQSPQPSESAYEGYDYGPDQAEELLAPQPEQMQFPPSSPMSMYSTPPPGWPLHPLPGPAVPSQQQQQQQQQQNLAIGKLASRPGGSGKRSLSTRVHVGHRGGSSTSASDDTDFGPRRRAYQALGRDYTSDADEDDADLDGKISLGKPNSGSEAADSFDTTERKVHAAAVLNNPELLMMYAQSFNDSIPGVRLHFTRIMCGYDQPAPPSPELSTPRLRHSGVACVDPNMRMQQNMNKLMRSVDERKLALSQPST